MDSRTDSFIKRFTNARQFFNEPSIHNIVSLKYREHCVNYSDYSDFVDDHIKNELKLKVKLLNGNFQGRAWLVSDDNNNSVILVEHETGLEILYVASAIASLISLIPIINSGWKYFRNRFSRHSPYHDERNKIEIRNLNVNNILMEQHVQNLESYIILESIQNNALLKKRIDNLEKDIKNLQSINTKIKSKLD
jgi:hypothetical protein